MPSRVPVFKAKMAGRSLADLKRKSPSRRGYNRHWVKWRSWFLNMLACPDETAQFDWQKNRSLECEECGTIAPIHSWELDHIKPLAQGGLKYDPNNIRLLCKPCHSRKTALENGWGRHG